MKTPNENPNHSPPKSSKINAIEIVVVDDDDWDKPFTSEELEAIDAAFESATSKTKNPRVGSDTTDDSRPKTRRRLPDSIVCPNGEPGSSRDTGSFGLMPCRTHSGSRQGGVHAIDSAIEAATTIVTPLISASSCPTNSSAASSVDNSDTTDDARPKTCHRLPDSISFSNGEAGLTQNPGSYGLTPSRTNSSFRQANVTLKYPPMNFGGRVVYCRTIEEVEEATLQILKLLEAKKCELGRAILGLDLEWKPSFNKGIPQGIAAVMQICGDMTHCYVLHIFHSGIPQSLKYLLEDSSSVKVGVGIDNDAVKLFHDYNVSIKSVQDLSILANQKLGVAPKQWSLSSLVETLTCKQLLKPKRIRLGNWEVNALSERQLQYAATDAFASWYLYEVLMSFPDPPDGQTES